MSAQQEYNDCMTLTGDPQFCLNNTRDIMGDPNWDPNTGGAWSQDPNNWLGLGTGLVGLGSGIWDMIDPSRIAQRQPVGYNAPPQQNNWPIYIGMGFLALLIVIVLIIFLSKK